MYKESQQKNRMAVVIVTLMFLSITFAAYPSSGIDDETSTQNQGGDYYHSGSIADALSNSNGVSDYDYKIGWSLEGVLGYAIAGDYAYVAKNTGTLSKIGVEDGVEVQSISNGVTSGIDKITVGGGLVLDTATGVVYNTDLVKQYTIGATSDQGYYNDGSWYVVKKNKECVCYSAQDEDPNSDSNEQSVKWTQNFTFYIDGNTLPVSLAFNDKYLFYPGIGASDANARILYCVDKNTGTQTDAFEMTEIRATYWNGGFIFCDGNTVEISTHWDTMFGPTGDGTKPVMFIIEVDSEGKFVQEKARYLTNGYNNSYGSQMVIKDGLGFVQTGCSFKVIDVETGNVIASTEVDSRLGKTYSNIAIAAGNDGFVRGYVAPAGIPTPLQPTDGLICFEYNKTTHDIRKFDLPVGEAVADNFNSVKIGPNGEVLFAKNDGKLYSILSNNPQGSKKVGDVIKFSSGSGKTIHNEKSDSSSYNPQSKVTISLTVLSVPRGYDCGWDNVGTLKITQIEFSENSDLMYIPSYFVDKVRVDGIAHIGLYKVVGMDEEVISQINEKEIRIVLPQALRDLHFSDTVTPVTESHYTDARGNVIHYSIKETQTAYTNGFGGYSMYANEDQPDVRYCEQGVIIKVDFADGETTYGVRTVNWAKNDMVSSDEWVCGSFADMVGAVIIDAPAPEPPVVEKGLDFVVIGAAIGIIAVAFIAVVASKT